MAAAFFAAGFQVWDVTMNDLLVTKVTLNQFSGVAFVGGFSYADVMDSAKVSIYGNSGNILFRDGLVSSNITVTYGNSSKTFTTAKTLSV
jgi:phosphoribosylformylglycinamidine (FGAM) synthase-like amidotransferase family enzyme